MNDQLLIKAPGDPEGACPLAVEEAVTCGDGKIIDAGDAAAHEAVIVKLPVVVAIRAEPLAGIIMPFVGEAHGDAVVGERIAKFNRLLAIEKELGSAARYDRELFSRKR